MAIDRTATLKHAENLLRQGNLEPAIAEYVRLVEDQPRDWNLANTLGDLYVRAGRKDEATDLFTRMADGLREAGFLPKAGAVYKKILKLQPEHEHSLLQAAEVAASLGLLADARSYLGQVIDHRSRRSDAEGLAQARIRLGSLDPSDYESRKTAARIRVEIGDVSGATRDFRQIADALLERGHTDAAIETLREAVAVAPGDEDVCQALVAIFLAAGEFDQARECASTAAQLTRLAAVLEADGYHDEAFAALIDASEHDPGDHGLRARLARTFLDRGQFAAASQFLTVDAAGDDPQLLYIVAEIRLRGDDPEGGLEIVRRLLEQDPERGEDVAMLGWRIAEQAPEPGFGVVMLAAEAALTREDMTSAAAALQEFVTRVPNHVPALIRLVEVCVDGGLESTMYAAQMNLADAYIAQGRAAEARFIAEDLVAREPWDCSNLDRFRRALQMQGESDPDSIIADRLSGRSPFMATDPLPAADVVPAPPPGGELFKLSANAIDLESILGEYSSAPASATGPAPADIDGVFARMREEASHRSGTDEPDQQYTRALIFRETGDIEACITALEAASRAPHLRFVTASLLGRIFVDRGMMAPAVEWLERAAEIQAPTAAEGHELLYDLADALEKEGESARALAVALELQADAGTYRDIVERVERLTRAQARG